LEVRNIAGLLSDMTPGLSNAYAGSILEAIALLVERVLLMWPPGWRGSCFLPHENTTL
jgi:hypothetical protein